VIANAAKETKPRSTRRNKTATQTINGEPEVHMHLQNLGISIPVGTCLVCLGEGYP
jgi:hypothetical protein